METRRAHNPEIAGSSPVPATSYIARCNLLHRRSFPSSQFGRDLSSSDRHEASQSRDAGVKHMLIKRLYKTVAMLLIIFLALYPFIAGAVVSEQQENTYSPEVGWLMTATTTQPTTDVVQPQLSVEAKILEAFPDAPIMVEVARCESQLNPLADRGNLNVDVGLFQINQVHLRTLDSLGLDRRNIDDNITYARILYDESGLNAWYKSRDCWAKFL